MTPPKKPRRKPPAAPPEPLPVGPPEGSIEALVAECVPASWNVFEPDPAKLQAAIDADRSPTWGYCFLWKRQGGQFGPKAYEEDGTDRWDVGRVTTQWIKNTWGPGLYKIQVYSVDAILLEQRQVTIEGTPHAETKPASPTANGSPAPTQRLAELRELLELVHHLAPPPPPPPREPLAEAVGAITTLLTTMQVSQQAATERHLEILQEMRRGGGGSSQAEKLVDKLLDRVLDAKAKDGGVLSKEDVLALLKKRPVGRDKRETNEWMELARDALESFGPAAQIWVASRLPEGPPRDLAFAVLKAASEKAAEEEEEGDEEEESEAAP